MEVSAVPLVCYFGGILSSTNSADYIGGSSTASFILKSITVSELHDKAKVTCGISEDTAIKLKCRYPLNSSMAITLDICDESSLAVAMGSIPTFSSSLVLYVEEVSKQSAALVAPSTVEGVDKHITIASPSKSRVPRTPHKMVRGRDIGWLHCKPVEESTNKTQCNYCGKVMSGGGITRMKQHLAGGSDVEECTKCGSEVRLLFRDLLRKKKQSKSEKRMKEQKYAESSVLLDCFEQEEAKEVSPMVQSQLSAGASGGRAHEEMALMDVDSDYYTVEGADKHLIIASPSESGVPRTPLSLGRGRDIGWLHCKPVGEGTCKTECNYCGKVMCGGGITRMKQHLAGGHDVEQCTKCGLEVRQMFRDLLRKKRFKSGKCMKRQRCAEASLLPDCAPQEAPKEVSPNEVPPKEVSPEEVSPEEVTPVVQSQQHSAGVSCSRALEEIAFMDGYSDD